MVSMKNLSLAMAAPLFSRTLAIPGETAKDSAISSDGIKRGIQEGLNLRSINNHLLARTDEARDDLEGRDLKERGSGYRDCCLFPKPGKGRGRRARDVNDLEGRDLDIQRVRKPDTSGRSFRRGLAGRGRHTRDIDDIEKRDVNDQKKRYIKKRSSGYRD
ncbi:unnamed protein product [Clonostachys rhizophaga]|uniref:Uncharacterized protein n=1 Tax=Clonostachys rhizophaga TaxID=160324 RepID=A0A9N9W1G4_9HYPO|nr:unnamed protein product [Clonostachys rhizophaga]